MVAHSGVNPQGPMMTFIKKDAITNIDVKRDDINAAKINTEYSYMKNRIPIGT